jgi:queuine tRNA-ribosyltransferase
MDDPRPLLENSTCSASQYSRGYLNHLLRANEMLGAMLLTWHNVHYYQELMHQIRQAIQEKRIEQFAQVFFDNQARGDIAEI